MTFFVDPLRDAPVTLRLPDPDNAANTVTLEGDGFRVGGQVRRVLRYPVGDSGWNEDLTALHEEHDAEGKHYIDVASRDYAISEVKRVLTGRPSPSVLEVGVSSGHFLRDLKRSGVQAQLLGADYTDARLDSLAASMPDIAFLQFDLTKCPLPAASMDAVVALNVLEHIEDDVKAASEVARILKPGGAAVIELPSGPELFDDFDRELMHFRRYRLREVAALFEKAGMTIERRSHLGFLLFPPFWLAKKRSQANARNKAAEPAIAVDAAKPQDAAAAAMQVSNVVGPVGGMVMSAESVLRKMMHLPFGIRCLVTARKPA